MKNERTHSSRPRQSTGARKGAASPRARRLLVREVIFLRAASAEPVPPLGMLNRLYPLSCCSLVLAIRVSFRSPAEGRRVLSQSMRALSPKQVPLGRPAARLPLARAGPAKTICCLRSVFPGSFLSGACVRARGTRVAE